MNRLIWTATSLAVLGTALILAGGPASSGLPADPTQPPQPPVAPGGVATPSIATPFSMKLGANGLNVPLYPADALRPWDGSEWVGLIPMTVTAVRYNASRHELVVSVDYVWRKSDEQAARDQLAAKYREAGKTMAPNAISIAPLQPVTHSLWLRDGDKEHLLSTSNRASVMTAQTVFFHLPMTEGADRLHNLLANEPHAVQIVLRASYAHDRLAGVILEQRAINSAWAKTLERIAPQEAKKAEALLVDADAEQELRRVMAVEVTTVLRSFGLKTEEEKVLVAQAREAVNSLGTLGTMSVADLLTLEDESFFLGVKEGKLYTSPTTTKEDLTRLKEIRARSEKLEQAAQAISDLASDSTIDDEKFHSQANRLVIGAGGSASGVFGLVSGSANFHLDKSWSDVQKSHYKEFKAARTYASNKSQYSKEVREAFNREAEGQIKTSTTIAPLLKLRRVSAAALASRSKAGWHYTRVAGSEVVSIDTPLSLKVTPTEPDPDVIAALVKKMREYEVELAQAKEAIGKLRDGQTELFRDKPVIAINGTSGSMRMGTDLLICWGEVVVGRTPNSPESDHMNRRFSFQFPATFAAPPLLTHGIDADKDTFSVFEYALTATGYQGMLRTTHAKLSQQEVKFGYVAIGRPKVANK